MKFRNAHSVT